MKFDLKTYFTEHEEDNVKGFTIIGKVVEDNEYYIAEKWSKDGDTKWADYYITEEALLARIEDKKCEKKATLTDDQYDAVCDKVENFRKVKA